MGKEEEKLSLFTHGMILYIQKALKTHPKTVRTNKFNKIAKCKINIQILMVCLYTKNKLLEKEIKKTIPFTMAIKRIKYLRVN